MLSNGRFQRFERSRISNAGKNNVNVEVTLHVGDGPSRAVIEGEGQTNSNGQSISSLSATGSTRNPTLSEAADSRARRRQDPVLDAPDVTEENTESYLPFCIPWNPKLRFFSRLRTKNRQEGSDADTITSTDGGLATVLPPKLESVSPDRVTVVSTRDTSLLSSLLSGPLSFNTSFQIYLRLMLPEKHGFPLWLPQPDLSLPLRYREYGIDIGDVGIITADGGFDFLFNIFRRSGDDEINPRQLPDNYDEIQRPSLMIYRQEDFFTTSTSISQGMSTSIRANPTDRTVRHFSYLCDSGEGAVLSVPDGASLKDLKNERALEDLIQKCAEDWYRYAIGPADRKIASNSLYLVTGCIKSKAWAIATYNRPLRSPHDTLELVVSTKFPRTNARYFWEKPLSATTRTGPSRDAEVDELPVQDNQCLFMRGFKIALSSEVWQELSETVALSTVNTGASNTQFSGSNTFGSPSNDSSSPKLGQSSQPSSSSIQDRARSSDLAAANSDRVYVEKMPSVPKVNHPSDRINEVLLQKFPEARIAITHDNDWRDLFSTNPEMTDTTDMLLKSGIQMVNSDGMAKLRPVVPSIELHSDSISKFLMDVYSDLKLRDPEGKGSFSINNLTDHVKVLDHAVYAFGGSSDIHKGFIEDSSGRRYIVALKVFRTLVNPSYLTRRIRRECVIWQTLNHRNVLRLLGVMNYRDQVALVSPFCPQGNLVKYLERIPKRSRLSIVIGVAEAVSYLHSKNILHGDLKCSNILIDESGCPLLCDFGRTTFADVASMDADAGSDYTSDTPGGALRYYAPELMVTGDTDDVLPTRMSEVYTFSMVALEMMTGKVPFYKMSEPQALLVVMKGSLPRLDDYTEFNNDVEKVWPILEASWARDPEARPSMESITTYLRHSQSEERRLPDVPLRNSLNMML